MAGSKVPSNPKVAVVGCGHWGRNLVRNFHDLGALASVCDVNAESAEEMVSAYSVPSRNIEEILGNDVVQGVILATPAEAHAEMVEARAVLPHRPYAAGPPS